MDPLTMQQRCAALDALRVNAAALAPAAKSSRTAAAAAAAPAALMRQSTPLSPEQCSILVDWIAKTCMHTQQSVTSVDASSLAAAAAPAAASSLPSYALSTHSVRLFRPLLSSLLARTCSDDATHLASIPAFMHAADILTHIATLCPHVLPTVTGWFRRAPFSLMDCLRAGPATSAAASSSDLTVAFTALRLLQLDATTYRSLWDWSSFLRLLTAPANLVRWLSASSAALLLHMNEHDKTDFVRQTLLPAAATDADASEQPAPAAVYQHYLASIKLEQSLVWVDSKESDAQSMPARSPEEAAETAAVDLTTPAAAAADAATSADATMDKQLSAHMVSLGGVLLPRRARPASASTSTSAAVSSEATLAAIAQQSPLIHVSSTASHLRSIGLALCERRPVLVEGPSGAGKTVLIEECARLCGQYDDLVRLHLDDQMDSKTLLGTYTCTDIPGEFKWVAGALTQAVMQGRWVIIEDVDRCPFEILSAIISLLERRELFLSGRGDTIHAAEGFQIFATKTVASNSAPVITESTPLLNALFSRVYVQSLTYQELCVILAQRLGARFASKKLLQQILATFGSFVALEQSAAAGAAPVAPFATGALLGSSRKYSTRDLLKWATRIAAVLRNAGYNAEGSNANTRLTSQMEEEVFLAALEVFVAPIPPPIRAMTAATAAAAAVASSVNAVASAEAAAAAPAGPPTPRQQVIAHIASLWHIDSDRVHYYTHSYKPRLEVAATKLSIGRVTLNRGGAASARNANAALLQNFAFTKYSLSMMEQMCMCVLLGEPVLLVSDTGVGKTTTIQYLASLLGKKLHVQNLNQQSDSADLIGGFKPVEVSKIIVPLMNAFGTLFPKTFSRHQNADFLNKLRAKFEEKKWGVLVKMMQQTVESAEKKLSKIATATGAGAANAAGAEDASTPRKQAKAGPATASTGPSLLEQWALFSADLVHFSHQLQQISSSFVFHFNEGALVTAIRNGDWILLDELNLASSETLERLSGILEGSGASLSLTERGDSAALVRHPDFRLFGAMNPASDAGKKNLPPSIRARFTEVYVEEMTDREDLAVIIKQYLDPSAGQNNPGGAGSASAAAGGASAAAQPAIDVPVPYDGIVSFYLQARVLSAAGAIQEGANSNPSSSNSKPHYSLRTLCRGMQYAKDVMRMAGVGFERAIYEGFLVSFCTLLTPESARKLTEIMVRCLGLSLASLALDTPLRKPPGTEPHTLVANSFWLRTGPEPISDELTAKFILTSTVRQRLKQLSRAMLSGKYPCLLQGPTSAGKTALVEYLALKTGHKFVRINNHEHTDLTEYMGAYVTDARTGKLVFQEGVLVEAVRKGHWVVLDELNLAPSEVLEALNRLLDDNRELFLPETQESIRPHPHFMLFATQNPSGGVYGGRKILSKAFRNRFVTLHVDDLPEQEVEEILHLRCKLPPSYCKAMIGTMKALSNRREKANVFAGKNSFMTPRDLYRWGERGPASYTQLAEDGFMLLGERLRTDEAKAIVKEVLEKQCKAKIDEEKLYSQQAVDTLIKQLTDLMKPDASAATSGAAGSNTALLDPTSAAHASNKEAAAIGKIAWTYNMRRLFVQVGRCMLFKEPVLLVGETGCGKTTVCQLFSLVLDQVLRVINCHQHTESSDFLGGLRPVRGKDKTMAEMRAALQQFFEQYQQAQTTAAAAAAASTDESAKAEDESEEMTDAETPAAAASSSSAAAISFALAPLSEESAAMIAAFDSAAATASLPDLFKTFRQYADPLLSLERQLQSAQRKYDAAVAEAEQKRAEKAKERKAKKYKKAAAAIAAADVDMDDGSALPPVPPANPVPAALWSSLLAVSASILSLHTRFQSLFEWVDGALVHAMRHSDLLLIDEISLAEDAVLERLNSVLESSRTLFLAEKGGSDAEVIRASDNFRIFATMNPGGDFGKKELSPALRNRFTEVWVPPFSNKVDLLHIITERMSLRNMHPYAESILEFVQWFNRNNRGAAAAPALPAAAAAAAAGSTDAAVATPAKAAPPSGGSKRYLSLRDVLSWVSFMNQALKLATGDSDSMSPLHAYLHGSCLTVLDGLGIGSTDSDSSIEKLKMLCIDKLVAFLPQSDLALLAAAPGQAELVKQSLLAPSSAGDVIVSTPAHFGIKPFVVPRGPLPLRNLPYALGASTTQTNLLRVLRALTLPKAVLLEGPPGVGKTSLLTTLAAAAGHNIVRINLSEQTDMMDLLGMDLPVAGGKGGEFRWCDGIFLQALKAGDWVLLDELNLASQSVLEGLNAVLDHRAQVFIPELDATFDCPPSFRIFACQNPMSQGGGRKGLPASFLNRFTKVYLHSLQTRDLLFITRSLNPHFPPLMLRRLIEFNEAVHRETMVTRRIGRKGFPWEFNLRDVFKLCELMRREQEKPAPLRLASSAQGEQDGAVAAPNPAAYIDLVYLQRMRTAEDRAKVAALYREIFGAPLSDRDQAEQDHPEAAALPPGMAQLQVEEYPTFRLTESYVQVGRAFLPRRKDISAAALSSQGQAQPLLVLQQLLQPLHHLATCLQYNFPVILLGEAATGKTSLVRLLSQLSHTPLHEILMTSGIDSSELLGCFEQVDLTRHKKAVLNKVAQLVDIVLAKYMCAANGVAAATAAGADDASMTDADASSGRAKSAKRGRDGKLTPTAQAAASVAALSLGSDAAVQHVSQMMHTWSMLDASFSRTTANSSSLLAQADAKESAQTLSTAAFSNEQYALLQSLLTSLQKLLPTISAPPTSFAVPAHLSPATLLSQAAHIQDLSHASGGKVIGNFEWLDGSLITALELGQWILLDNVNFTNPTVLDRLNPLLESDGVLLVNECGLVDGAARIIKPHPNFRMILAMDQRYGEISRAMRNRCVEICLTTPIGVQAPAAAVAAAASSKQVAAVANGTTPAAPLPNTAVSPSVHDLIAIVNSLGIQGLALPEFMVSVHASLCRLGAAGAAPGASSATNASLKSLSVRNLKHWSLLAAQQVQSGSQSGASPSSTGPANASLFASLWLTFKHAYNLSMSGSDPFATQLTAMFDQQYRKSVLQQGEGQDDRSAAQRAVSSLLAPTLWPTAAHDLWAHPSPAQRTLAIQGSVLKYLSLLALGQVVSERDQHLLHLFRALVTEHAGREGGSLAFLPDKVWQFVFGLSQTAPAVSAKKEETAVETVAASADKNAAVSPMDRQLLLPVTSLTPAFSLSTHPLHPHPTSLQLFHLSLLAFLDYSNVHDHRERALWLQRELLDGVLFGQSVGTPATTFVVDRLRLEVQLAVRTLGALYAHPLVQTYSRDMDALVERCGFDARVLAPAINPHVDPTFLQLLRIHARGSAVIQMERMLSQWESVRLLIQSTYQSLFESHVHSGVAPLLSNPSQLSLLELSYACYTNLIHAARLNSLVSGLNSGAGLGGGLSADLILQLHPFWAAMQALENNMIEHGFTIAQQRTAESHEEVKAFQKVLGKFIADKNFFWRTIYDTKGLLAPTASSASKGASAAGAAAAAQDGQAVNSMLDQIHVRWKGLSKRVTALVALVPGLDGAGKTGSAAAAVSASASASALQSSYVHFQSFFSKLQSTLQGTTHSSTELVGVKDTLWKRGGHPLLARDQALQVVEAQLQAIERQIMYRPAEGASNAEGESRSAAPPTNRGTQPFFIVDQNFKDILIEAFVNLKFLYLQGGVSGSGSSSASEDATAREHHELLAALSTVPGVLSAKLRACVEADRAQLDSMRFHVQIVGEGEESLEDLGFDSSALPERGMKKEEEGGESGAMEIDEEDDGVARPSAHFLSVSADATFSSSTRFGEQSSHKKSYIMPQLLPVFDLAYLEQSRTVLAHVEYAAFCAGQIRRALAAAATAAKAKTKRIKGVKKNDVATVASATGAFDGALLHSVSLSLVSALSSLLSFLPSLLSFYTGKTSAISGLLDQHALKLVELVGASLRDEVQLALAGVDAASVASAPAAAAFAERLAVPKLAELFSHLPSLIQEIKYHYSNFLSRFLSAHAPALRVHAAHSHADADAGLDSSLLLTPVKSLLVLELISQSLNISLIHRHSKRIQLQMLGEYLARDLIRTPRVSKRDRAQTGLVLLGAAAARSTDARTAHASMLECVSLLTAFHALLLCFADLYPAADHERVLRFLSATIRALLEQATLSGQRSARSVSPLPSSMPADVQQSMLKVRDPRLYSLLQPLAFPFVNTLLAHLSSLQSAAPDAARESSVWFIGHATLHLSLLRFYLLLPVSPVDSNQKYFVLLRDETYAAAANRMALERAQWCESLQSGNASSREILELQRASRGYTASIAALHRQVTYRRYDPAHTKPFHALFHEFHRFANTFLDLAKLRAQFLLPLSTGASASASASQSDAAGRLEEELSSFQSNSSEFILRMQSSFSEYPDFIVPLLTALYGVKHGISSMHHAYVERREMEEARSDADKQRAVYQTIRALVCFPFGAVDADAAGEQQQQVAVASVGAEAAAAPGLIPPLNLLTLPPVLSEIDSLCRAAVSIIKEQSAVRRAEARAAAEASAHRGDVDTDTMANELIDAGTLKTNTASFYSIRLGVLSIVLARILLFSRVSGRLTPALLQILDQLFRNFILIYKSNLEKAAAKDAEEAATYKYKEKKVEVLTEEEKDKVALALLFPDYSKDFADIVGQDGAPLMDDEVEAAQRRQQEYKEATEERARAQADSEDEWGILHLTPEHLSTIYNAFTAIFSIQKAASLTSAVTSSPSFTDAESAAYSQAYTSSYEVGSTLLHALSMQGKLATSALIPSPASFEAELKPGHLFLLCTSLHKLHLSGGADGNGRDEVSAIMESFMSEESDETTRTGAIAMHHGDASMMQVNTDELDEGFKIDGKTGTKASAGLLSTAAAAGAKAASKIDWSKFPDVYHESNVLEYRKLERPLTLLMLRLRHLLNQFAHHPILMQLLQLAHRVLNLSSNTPLMKVLTGLELLLKKAEDWEQYAARHVSIKKELIELGILVARWRKMELYTWPKALASREQAFHQSALKGWFQLYGLIHTDDEGIANFFPAGTYATRAETEDAFLQKLYEALDEFLQFSNVGELKTRMSILLGFYQQMNLEIVEGFAGAAQEQGASVASDSDAHRTRRMSLPLRLRISHLLINLYQYYEQFVLQVDDIVRHKKGPIEKSLREQVKLAKWDLSNFWALKESADKSHRKLQKFSKEYEEILLLQFRSIIAKDEERDAKEGDDSVSFGRAGAEVAEARSQLEKLQKHLTKQKEKAKRKQDKARAAALAAGVDFQEDEEAEDQAGDAESALPSLAQSLTIVLPDAEHYLSDREHWDAWFIKLDQAHDQAAGGGAAAAAAGAADDADMDGDSAPGVTRAIPTVSSYQSRLPTLYHKMRVLVGKGLLSPAYSDARQECLLEVEGFAIHVISRVHKLTLPDAKFTYKKKAFGDIVKSLREMGLTHHVSALKATGAPAAAVTVTVLNSAEAFQAQTASIPTLFMQAPLTAVFLKSSAQLPLSTSEGYEFLRSLAKKCEAYLYRVWSGVRKMRSRAAGAHKDLNAAEAQRAKGMVEHVFFLLCNQRQQVSQAAVHYHTMRKWIDWITELDVDTATTSVKQEDDSAAGAAGAVAAAFPSWSSRFWSHKHQLDSLFSCAKYASLLYTRMGESMTGSDQGPQIKAQLEEGMAKVRGVLAALSAAKIEMDGKVAKLFPNLQMATQTSATAPASAVTDGTTAAESVLELNDQPNAAFLLGNIERILSAVTVPDVAPTPAAAADPAAAISLVDTDEEEGAIIELPYLSTTSAFNELVISLIRSKYEIRAQARAALAAPTQTVAAVDASADVASVSSLSRDFTSSYHSLISMLLLSVQSSFKHVKAQAELADRRARVAAGEEEAAGTGKNALPDAKMLVDEMQVAEAAVAALHMRPVNDKLHELTVTLNRLKRSRAHDQSADAAYRSFRLALHNVVPLLDQVLLLSERSMGASLNLHRSYLKLSHVLLSVLNKILARGFCRKPDEPEEEQGEGPTEEAEGTGMGEGEGKKDVSDQITDEEQLLGNKDPLEDEKEAEKNPEAPPDPQQPDTDEGLEMDGDFDGDMHDVPKDDEEKEQQGEKDGEEKDELDKEMGELGDQKDVVDEKMWEESDDEGDDDDKQKKKEQEKIERDAPIEGANPDDDEMAAKEEGADEDQGKKKPPPPDKEEKAPAPDEEHPEPEAAPDDGQKAEDSDGADDEEEGEDPSGQVNQMPEYEDKHDVDPMTNLPDDLALDDEEDPDKEKENAEDEQGDEAMDEAEQPPEESLDPEKQAALEGDQKMDEDGDDGGEDVGEDLEKNEVDESEQPDENNPEQQEQEEAQNTVEADQQAADAPEPDAPEDDSQEPEPERPDQHADPDQKDTNQGAHRVAGGEQGRSGAEEEKELDAPEKDKPKAAPAPDEQQESEQKQDDQTLDQANSNDAAEGTESEWQPQSAQSHSASQPESQADKKKKKPQPKQAPNPFKSLGDAAKKWQERLRILDNDDSKEEEGTQLENENEDGAEDGDETLEGTVENVSDKQKADAQMMGPVEQKLDSEDMPKLQTQPEVAEDKQPEPELDEYDQQDPDAGEKPDKDDDDAAKKQQESRKRGGAQQLQPSRMADDSDSDSDGDSSMGDAEPADDAPFDPFADEDDENKEEELAAESRIGAMEDIVAAAAANPAADPNSPDHAEYLQSLRDDLDAALQAWDSTGASDRNQFAHQLWHKFTDLTADLSASLCESLRMILEPLIATKLKGDYKTGKRISIKKIIPYIASSFRKDKIWLKRTKPNKRHYQVLVAIDDSHSMRNHRAGRLALEAMTVLCKALSALEVGELAIASFGSQVQLLHPFNRPFTDESGAFAIGHFEFQQQFTRWPELLERTVAILDEAKGLGGGGGGMGAEHHQLVFIISDARVQQDRELVAKWTREALSKNQLLVLIIVEGGEAKDSIQNTKTVSYPQGKIKITEYLDDFPFPYYILLREIESLPEIVADALRQWFELIRSSA